jgi:hypothetical protein
MVIAVLVLLGLVVFWALGLLGDRAIVVHSAQRSGGLPAGGL